MNNRQNRWANQQIIWGFAFLIAMLILLIYLLITQAWPRMTSPVAPTVEPIATEIIASTPEETIESTIEATAVDDGTPLAQAQATLSAAALKPIVSAADVRHAAETVIAVTAQANRAPEVRATEPVFSSPTPEPTPRDETATLPEEIWIDRILGIVSALTAVVTLIGLVVTSVLKWRADVRAGDRSSVDFEREKVQFELQKQRFELDRIKAEMELEQQRLELERKRLDLAEMHQPTDKQTGDSSNEDSSDEGSSGDEPLGDADTST